MKISKLRLSALVLLSLMMVVRVRAQDHTIAFSPTAPGVSAAITNWGLDTCWPSVDNMKRGLIFMGSNNVNIVRVGFVVDAPLTNNDLSASQKAELQNFASIAALAPPGARWDMNWASSLDPWYQSVTTIPARVYPDRWAAAIEAAQRYYNRGIWMVEGFNEPDYIYNGEGSQQDLYDIFGYLQASTNFPGTRMAGGSTLNSDPSVSWFNAVAARASAGTTHNLAGSAANYVNFLQTVTSSNAMPFAPEMHNVVEALLGVNYGLKGGIWWGTAEWTRGSFVKTCQGTRLGYADDLNNWTAAAVYRGTNGAVQAFAGGAERTATTTTYRLFAKDRDVFYDGKGPQRAYTMTVPGGTGYGVNQPSAEQLVNITWGADVPPAIGGRYIVVNRNSGKALEVPGAATGNGVVLDQTTYTGALNQQWDINQLTNTFGGDFTYYTIINASSGITADVQGGSYDNGAVIQQWNGGTNVFEQWILQYTTNGYFKLRTRWCNKVMGVNGASTSSGATILQWDDTGTPDHEWRLIPVSAGAYDFTAPAAPTGVTAVANPVSVKLSWNTNSASDFAGYTVLRATNAGGPYEIAARGLTTNTFTDKFANQNQTYYYYVKAVDRSLNSSINSALLSAKPSAGPTLMARYSFDGSFSDGSVNANHPIITNGLPAFVAGKFGSAMDLSGTNQYLMLPANLFASVTNFTIAVWVNWDGGNAWQRIFDCGNDTSQYMFLTPGSGGGTLRFAVTTNNYWNEQMVETAPLPVGQWEHVAVTLNGTTARLYTNGVLAAAGTITIPPASFNPALNYLGESQFATDPLFNGRLDELFIYNYALSDAEIARLATANQPPPPAAPTTLSVGLAGNLMNFSWPSNYTGCRLQVQTNALVVGLGTNWSDVSGSSQTNQMTLPLNTTSGSLFYRLVYP